MAYIYSHTNDGVVTGPASNNYTTARNATTGIVVDGDNTDSVGVTKARVGRDFVWQYHRAFFFFSLSGESGTVDSCTFEVYNSTGKSVYMMPVFHDAGIGLVSDDYNNVFSSGTDMTEYGLAVAFTSSGYNTFNLNAAGISALQTKVNSEGVFEIAIVARIDSTAGEPPATETETITFGDSTLNKPRIEITYGVAAVTDNSIFFGANF